ncbi:MAG: molybdopterin-dependent oxidoreductase, partial [Pseudomonadota bacterium]
VAYGRSGSRYELNKRAVEDKNMGPLVKTIMTRCIQCTRCVRFAAEVAGVEELGMISRGESAEITTYLENSLTSELSGNVIDLCPVGALTSKPYAFNARPWELRKTESIDVMDAMGSAIRVDAKGNAVMRIMPVVNEEVNEEWLSDKSRFIWDGLARQRLDTPYVRQDGRLVPVTWDDALAATAQALSGPAEKTGFVAGDLVEMEQLKAAQDLAAQIGTPNIDCRPAGARYGTSGVREHYILNPTFMGVEDADAVILIGTNPRKDAAVWNARIRKSWLWNDLKVYVVGEAVDLTFDYEHLGTGPDAMAKLATLTGHERPMIVIGEDALIREDGDAVFAAAHAAALKIGAIKPEWAGFGVLHTAAARVGALDLGFVPKEGGRDTASMLSGELETLVLLGADEVDLSGLGDTKVIYVGHHGDAGASRADIVLPCVAYTELAATYVNTEGRVQMTQQAVNAKGDAREGWAIFRALSSRTGAALPYDSAEELRNAMREAVPHLAGLGFAPGHAGDDALLAPVSAEAEALKSVPFVTRIQDFYLSNPVARASKTMAECSQQKQGLETALAAE